MTQVSLKDNRSVSFRFPVTDEVRAGTAVASVKLEAVADEDGVTRAAITRHCVLPVADPK